MAKLWQYIKSLFQDAEESSSTKPFIHEVIERTTEEKTDYERWTNSLVKRRLIDWLDHQYTTFLSTPSNVEETIDFLNTTSSKGFVVHFNKTGYNVEEITHFFDYLKNRILLLHYKRYVSDTRTFTRNTWVETINRHYLKPSFKVKAEDEEKKFNQQFGNINIEMLLRDEKVINLKFSATAYKDHKFQEASDFQLLMQHLLSS